MIENSLNMNKQSITLKEDEDKQIMKNIERKFLDNRKEHYWAIVKIIGIDNLLFKQLSSLRLNRK